MTMKKLLIITILIPFLISCGSNSKPNFVQDQPDVHKVKLMEALHTNSYTYLLVKENGEEQWLAVPLMEAVVGKFYYYKGGMEMPDFTSKELNREFESVLFLENVSDSPDFEEISSTEDPTHSAMVKKDAKMNLELEPVEGVVTIGELYSNKKKYEGKTIKVRGQVTKFNPEIMDRNWIHIQDGTEYEGLFDLTVTSALTFKAGVTVTLEGKIALDRDFGYGYTYDIILEEAVLIE